MRAVLNAVRYWLPVVAAFGCLIGAAWAGPVGTWLLLMLAFGLLLDVGTALFEKAGRIGGLRDYKQ